MNTKRKLQDSWKNDSITSKKRGPYKKLFTENAKNLYTNRSTLWRWNKRVESGSSMVLQDNHDLNKSLNENNAEIKNDIFVIPINEKNEVSNIEAEDNFELLSSSGKIKENKCMEYSLNDVKSVNYYDALDHFIYSPTENENVTKEIEGNEFPIDCNHVEEKLCTEDEENRENKNSDKNKNGYEKRNIIDDDDESCDSDDFVEFQKLHNWNMFPQSNCSVADVLNMLQAISLRYNLSKEARFAIFQMIKILAGPEFQNWNLSKFSLNKLLHPSKDKINYIFYCPKCCIEVSEPLQQNDINKNQTVLCQQCNERYDISSSEDNYFLMINIEKQLQSLLQNENIQTMLRENCQRKEQLSDEEYLVITDIQDTERYKDMALHVKKDDDEKNRIISFNVNIDGAEMLKSSTKSLWPIQLIINELPLSVRFKTVILAALWYTNVEPHASFMNLYLKFLLKFLIKFSTDGIKVLNKAGETITYYCFLFSCAVDSVARPIIQNRFQFNGYFGCSWCYIHGKCVNRTVKYEFTGQDIILRSHLSYLQDIDKVTKINRSINGVKGESVMTSLQYFDCIWGYSLDYMHSVLLGVVRQLWTFWSKNIFSKRDRDLINKRLINIKPTREVHRLPKPFTGKMTFKASEWEYLFIFYSVPCLMGILDPELLKSYVLLVRSVTLLMSSEITETVLLECEISLLQFITDCQRFYTEEFMTFNIHILTHIVDSVKHNGPLWASSTYPFENYIHILKNYVSGPKNVMQQIAHNILQKNELDSKIFKITKENLSANFCREIFEYRRLTTKYCISSEGAILIDEIIDRNNKKDVCLFKRCCYKKCMYQSKIYTRPKKTINFYAKLKDGSMVEIQYFLMKNNKCFMCVVHIIVKAMPEEYYLTYMYRIVRKSNEVNYVEIECLKQKVLYIDIFDDKNGKYICETPLTIMPF